VALLVAVSGGQRGTYGEEDHRCLVVFLYEKGLRGKAGDNGGTGRWPFEDRTGHQTRSTPENLNQAFVAIASISTLTPMGKPATCTVARAGL
jgi:hypothetical protein